MQNSKSSLIAASLGLTAYGYAVLPSVAADQISMANCAALDAAISSTEDFAEVALASDNTASKAGVATIGKTFEAIGSAMSSEQKTAGQKQIALIHVDLSNNNLAGAALQATELYRLINETFQERLPIPLEVAMLDYAGFRIHALLAQKTIDWQVVLSTANEAGSNWNAKKDHIKDRGLSDLATTLHIGLVAAATAENSDWLNFAAQMLLDSVDLLEKNITATGKQACH